MDLFNENASMTGISRPSKGHGGNTRQPLGEITSNVIRPSTSSAKVSAVFYSDEKSSENDCSRISRASKLGLPLQHIPLPYVIHEDSNEPQVSSGFGDTGFPSPPPIPSVSELSAILPPNITDFRQNISISSVSTEGGDDFYYYEDEDNRTESDVPSSSLKEQPSAQKSSITDDTDNSQIVDDEEIVWAVSDSVLAVDVYADEIFASGKLRELEYVPKFNYMEKQRDISFPMRSILVDWLVEVCEEFELQTETMYLACNFVDRFLSFMSVQRAKLQLVGTASMFVASKYEEIYPPDLTKFVYITDDTYNKRQLLKMEKLLLGVLKFSVSAPTAHYFVTHLAKMAECNSKTTCLAKYLAELTLIDGETYLLYLPSIIGAAAVALARHTLGFAAWEETMARRTGYSINDFQSCLISLHGSFSRAGRCPQQSVVEKYKDAKYQKVACIEPTPIF